MTWTRTAPDEPGAYWYRLDETQEPSLCQVWWRLPRLEPPTLYVSFVGKAWVVPASTHVGEWLGPLEPREDTEP